jgi:hypothetical protein
MKNQLTHHKIEKPNIYYRNLFRYCLIIIFIFSFLLPPNYTSLDIISFEDIHQSSNINSITWPMNKSVEEQIYSNFFKNCTLFENSGQNIYKASTATGDFIFQSRKINLIPYSNEEINLFSMKGQLNQFNISTIDNESLNSIDVEKNIIKSINFTFIDSYNIEPRGINEISGFINEYYGKNIDNWKENIKIFDKIEYKNLYNNIDLEYKIINGSLKYSFFLVRPSNYQQIKIHIDGHKNLYIDGNGNLHIGLSFYEMIE